MCLLKCHLFLPGPIGHDSPPAETVCAPPVRQNLTEAVTAASASAATVDPERAPSRQASEAAMQDWRNAIFNPPPSASFTYKMGRWWWCAGLWLGLEDGVLFKCGVLVLLFLC